jgi:hypothetical protein
MGGGQTRGWKVTAPLLLASALACESATPRSTQDAASALPAVEGGAVEGGGLSDAALAEAALAACEAMGGGCQSDCCTEYCSSCCNGHSYVMDCFGASLNGSDGGEQLAGCTCTTDKVVTGVTMCNIYSYTDDCFTSGCGYPTCP